MGCAALRQMGAEAVKTYVRLVPLELAARRAAFAVSDPDLAQVVYKALLPSASSGLALNDASTSTLPEWASTVAALAEPLAVEVEVASPLPAMPPWIRDTDVMGKFHVCSTFYKGVRLGDMKTRCGWRFGAVAGVVTDPEPPLVAEFLSVCLRCAPQLAKKLEADFYAPVKWQEL